MSGINPYSTTNWRGWDAWMPEADDGFPALTPEDRPGGVITPPSGGTSNAPAVMINVGQSTGAVVDRYGPPTVGASASPFGLSGEFDGVALDDPRFWLQFSEVFPEGWTNELDGPTSDALDFAAWSVSLAKDLDVPWETYRDLVQQERYYQIAFSSSEAANAGGSYFFSFDPTGGPRVTNPDHRMSNLQQMENAFHHSLMPKDAYEAFRADWMSNWMNPHRAGFTNADGTQYQEAFDRQRVEELVNQTKQALAGQGIGPQMTSEQLRDILNDLGYDLKRVADGLGYNASTDSSTVVVATKTKWEVVWRGGEAQQLAQVGNALNGWRTGIPIGGTNLPNQLPPIDQRLQSLPVVDLAAAYGRKLAPRSVEQADGTRQEFSIVILEDKHGVRFETPIMAGPKVSGTQAAHMRIPIDSILAQNPNLRLLTIAHSHTLGSAAPSDADERFNENLSRGVVVYSDRYGNSTEVRLKAEQMSRYQGMGMLAVAPNGAIVHRFLHPVVTPK